METQFTVSPVREIAPVVPEVRTAQPDLLLQDVVQAIMADSWIEPAAYLHEVIVMVGGE